MSTTDPYLLEEDQRHARNLRPHTLHDHEQRHLPGTGDGETSPSGSNRLNDFASHILESHDPHDQHPHEHEHGDEHEHSHGHVLSFTGEGGVLESQVGVGTFDTEVENAMRQAMDDGEFQPHIEDGRDIRRQHDHDIAQEGQTLQRGEEGQRVETAPKVARTYNSARGKKRKNDDNGEPLDQILQKKDAHVSPSPSVSSSPQSP